jgi:hypothetical protein
VIHQGGGFDGGVPAVDVVRGVGFGDAEGLRFFQRFVEGEAFFHLARGSRWWWSSGFRGSLAGEPSALIEERKNWDAIHDGGFEEESSCRARREIAELAVGVDDGAFVGGDGVGSVLEGGADVVDGGLSGFDVERCGFEEDVGLGGGEPGADVGQLLIRFAAVQRAEPAPWTSSGQALSLSKGVSAPHLFRRMGIQTIRVGDPTQAAGGDAGDAVGDAVAIAQFLRRGLRAGGPASG